MASTSPRDGSGDHDIKRSRSPQRQHGRDRSERSRSRSPHHKHKHRHHHNRSTRKDVRPLPSSLPFHRESLSKSEYDQRKALFAYYLDVQKRLDVNDLDQDQVRGRWKSFVGKWNRGELAEGWYDPTIEEKAVERYQAGTGRSGDHHRRNSKDRGVEEQEQEDDEDEDGYGPALPSGPTAPLGPTIPNFSDLQHRQELVDEDRSSNLADLRYSRKQDRSLQKERLDELAPRADPGSKERQMEKKRETTAVNREFRDAKEAGDVEVGDGDLMGDDGIEGYKAKLKANRKVKNEREVRKEEVLRARAAEREDRMREVRAKEDKTMEMLRGLARQRFG